MVVTNYHRCIIWRIIQHVKMCRCNYCEGRDERFLPALSHFDITYKPRRDSHQFDATRSLILPLIFTHFERGLRAIGRCIAGR